MTDEINFGSGSCSLLIRGTDIDLDQITSTLSVQPTKTMRKGQIRNVTRRPMEFDYWEYEIRFESEEGCLDEAITNALRTLLSDITPHGDYLKRLATQFDVIVNCFVQSDMAQLGFTLKPGLIADLHKLGIEFEIEIFSFGMAIDRDTDCP